MLLLLTSNWKLSFCIRSLQCDRKFVLVSTKVSNQPDGSPCNYVCRFTWMESSPVVNGPEEAEQQEEVLVEERQARPSPEVGPVYQDDVYLGGGNVYELYRVVQQNFYMMFDIYLSFFSITSVKQHICRILYFYFWCKIQLDLPVSGRRLISMNCAGWPNKISSRKLKYFIWCLTDIFLFIVQHLSNSIYNISISGVKSSWNSLYMYRVPSCQ